MQVFIKETLPSDPPEITLKHVRKTKNPCSMSSKKWTKKVVQCLQLRALLDENARKTQPRETLEEKLFPSMSGFWHKNLVRIGMKRNVTTKEFISNLENFE